jgi:peptidoglycan/xylan/chitin deacetylase (PgdA/CDA1 family)
MLRILTYHRIGVANPLQSWSPRMISATPAAFAAQMRHIARHWQPVSASAVLAASQGGEPLPERSVLVTFDDGYRDFRTQALPILQAHGIPVVLFVPTRFADEPQFHFWWDRLYRALHHGRRGVLTATPLGPLPIHAGVRRQAQRRLEACLKSMPHETAMQWVDRMCAEAEAAEPDSNGVLNWDELRALKASGVTIASHTHEHPLLTRVSDERAAAELHWSQERLQHELGSCPPMLCYPAGAFDSRVMALARAAGFTLGLTQCDGHNDLHHGDLLQLCRTNVTPKTNTAILGLRLQAWAPRIDRWRHRHRRVA